MSEAADALIAQLASIDLNAYEEQRLIGQGVSGSVLLVRHRTDHTLHALKQIRVQTAEETRRALEEAQRMFTLRHPSLVEATGVHVERLTLGRCEVSILMEFCEGGDLEKVLRGLSGGQGLGEEQAVNLLSQLIVVLDFVHSSGAVHRDIKPANLLLNADRQTLKLADLGLARRIDSSSASRGAGTIAYMSSEAFTDRPASSMDIWSVGIVAIELVTKYRPDNTTQTQTQVEALLERLNRAGCTPAFREAVAGMLRLDPADRPSAAELLRFPLFLRAALAQHERSAAHVSPSLDNLQGLVSQAPWLAPHLIEGLPWEQATSSSAMAVRLCACTAGTGGADTGTPRADACRRAAAGLLSLIQSAPGNANFSERYNVHKSVLCFSRARASMHMAQALDLGFKVSSGLLSVERNVQAGAPEVVRARQEVLRRLASCPSLSAAPELGGVRVLTAFHLAPSEEIARSIMQGGFAILGTRDDGYYGQGIYVTLDAEYAIEEYGRRQGRQTRMALVVCAVIVGSIYPVVEMPSGPGGFLGGPLTPRADTHVAVVAWGKGAAPGSPAWLPCPPERWEEARRKTYTELVLRYESQLLPLGYMMVQAAARHDPNFRIARKPSVLADTQTSWLEGQLQSLGALALLGGVSQNLVTLPTGTSDFDMLRSVLAEGLTTEHRVLCVKNLQAIKSPALVRRFNAHRPPVAGDSEYCFLMHGTSLNNAINIAREGFDLPTERDDEGRFLAGSSSGIEGFDLLRFGGGIYLSSGAAKANVFAKDSEGQPAIVICAVKLGCSKQVRGSSEEYSMIEAASAWLGGFDSVYFKWDEYGSWDEYVVYTADAVLPMFIATYQTVATRDVDFFLEQQYSLEDEDEYTDRQEVSASETLGAFDQLKAALAGRFRPPEALRAFDQLKAALAGLDVTKLAATADLVGPLSIIGDAAQSGGINASSVAFLENQESMCLLSKTLQASCEMTQWQALRVLSNFCFESKRRQDLLHRPRIFAELFHSLCTLLASPNVAVVQKATFLACNITSHHDPPDGDSGDRLIKSLVDAVESTGDTTCTFYVCRSAASDPGLGRSAPSLLSHVRDSYWDRHPQPLQTLWLTVRPRHTRALSPTRSSASSVLRASFPSG